MAHNKKSKSGSYSGKASKQNPRAQHDRESGKEAGRDQARDKQPQARPQGTGHKSATSQGQPHRSNAPYKQNTNRSGGKPSGSKPQAALAAVNTAALPASLRSIKPDHSLLFGRHAVVAALENKRRQHIQLILTDAAHAELLERFDADTLPPVSRTDTATLSNFLGTDSPHQGFLLEAKPLPPTPLEDIIAAAHKRSTPTLLLALDQVTDPHNVGALIRSAAALGAQALITTDRNSPPQTGTLAKSASGALEVLPWARVGNLSKALDALKDKGFWTAGLDGYADADIGDIPAHDKLVIVMGAEGRGLRPLVAKHCDLLVKIPMSGLVESLNVSNAAAIALYSTVQKQKLIA